VNPSTTEFPPMEPLPPELDEHQETTTAGLDREVESEAVGPTPPPPRIYADLIGQERIDADAVKVLRRLTRHGYTAYLVGGGVRDLLLGREPKDFDIATSARPNEIRRLFRNCRIIGRRFRLAHILFAGGKVIEVATFRRDPTTNQRNSQLELDDMDENNVLNLSSTTKDRSDDADLLIRQDNAFGLPHEDAIRRDFTINGLFYDLDRQEVIDYVGGVHDLEAGVVRTIGQPDVRFREDPIRILRAIKFSARLDLGVAPEVYDAMVDQRAELSRSAAPRLFEELLRLLRGGAAQRSLYLCWDAGVLGVILPELSAYLDDQGEQPTPMWDRLAAIDEMKREDRLPGDAVLLATLLYDPMQEAVDGARSPAPAFESFFEGIIERLALPRRMRDRIRLIFAAQRRLDRGRHGGMRRREFFLDAATLYEIRLSAAGQEAPDWLIDATPNHGGPNGRDDGRHRPPRRRRNRNR